MRVFVTGSAGFIGGHLCRKLVADGHEVTGIDRRSTPEMPGLITQQLDLLDERATREALKVAAPDVVLHLAARTDLDERRDINGYRDNFDAVLSLSKAIGATLSVERWICTSSQLVCRVGYTPEHDTDYAPSTLYGESKVRTERIVRAGDSSTVPWTIVRPTSIWGPGMNQHYLKFFRMIRDGRYFHVGRGPAYTRAAARVGDVIAFAVPKFPFTSFRLENVLTPYQADVAPTRAVCGEVPYSVDQGIDATAKWLLDLWSDRAA